jgi:adenylate cyclase
MIRIKDTGKEIPSSPAISILNLLQRNDVEIQTLCGGRAQCGRCMIRILSGAEKMNKKNRREIVRLKAMHAGSDMRLACQSYTRGDVEIRIVNSGRRADPRSPK